MKPLPRLPSRLRSLSADERAAFALDVRPSPLFPVFLKPRLEDAWRRLGRREAAVPVLRFLLVRLSRVAARVLAHELKASGRPYSAFMSDPEVERGLLEKYPVLGRLLDGVARGTVDGALEVFERLEADRKDIARTFFGGRDPGPVLALRPGLSDPHRGGRTVARLDFAGGRSLIHKPRPADADLAYAEFVRRSGLALPLPRVLPRRGWSWHERLAVPAPRGRRADEARGAHLALLSILGATDVHAENFASARGVPAPVDLEGLFGHAADLRWAPLASGLLPARRDAGPDALPEVSGRRPYSYKRAAWRGEGTSGLAMISAVPKGPAPRALDGAALLRGFERAAKKVLARRVPLPEAPRTARVLLRGTQDYLEWLHWSAAPDLLASEEAFEGALERFSFTPEEREALRRHDVPALAAPAARRPPASAAELSAARVIAAAALRLPDVRLRPRRGEPLLAHAVAIGETLAELAVPGPFGPVWLGLARVRDVGRDLALTTTDPFLYSGGAGVALFLDALAEASGRSSFRRLAKEALDGSLAAARRAPALPRSGFTGAGSLIYALAAAGRFDEAEALVPAPVPADPDVLNGDAGLCPALLCLHRRRPSPKALAAARAVGEGLLWSPPGAGAGFGHGPAGTAAALSRLHAATGEARWREGAARLRAESEIRRAPGGWCSGDVGRELALLETGGRVEAAPLAANARHNLCCGEAGRIVLLARAGRRDDARRAARDLVAFEKSRGVWRFQGFTERPFLPGLMGGVSGIGLALLTALDPASAPDVLRLS